MASPTPPAAASSSGDLLNDAIYEILMRLSAKELCRLRAVSPSWRALTSDPLFVASHKSRHTAPLLAIAYRDDDEDEVLDIVDLSGNLVRRIASIDDGDITVLDQSDKVLGTIPNSEDNIRLLNTRLDLVFFMRSLAPLGLWVVNPATGATLALPECRSEELEAELALEAELGRYCYSAVESCAVGQVSTGEYKVLRIIRLGDPGNADLGRQLFEVVTVDGADHGAWRRMEGPRSQALIWARNRQGCVVVDGVAYFLMDFHSMTAVEPGSIASFNLETEEWMPTLRGPAPVRRFNMDEISLAELDVCLVTVYNTQSSTDLWFLTDSRKGTWVKKYSMPSQDDMPFAYPILVLDDGRILFTYGGEFIRTYDPRTGTYAHALRVKDSSATALYTGSLLS